MKAEEVTDSKIWEEFVSKQSFAPFLQSWAWGKLQEEIGHQVWRMGWQDGGKLVAAALLTLARTKLGNVAYSPYGPVLDWGDEKLASSVLTDLLVKVKGVGGDFLRIDPRVERSDELVGFLNNQRFRKAPHFVQAEYDWVVSLKSRTTDQLLSETRKTTRYLIRKAESIGVEVKWSVDPRDLPVFLDLLEDTVKRQGFVGQGRSYLTKQFEILSKEGIARLVTATYEGRALAAAIVMFYGDNVSYVHGASVASSEVPASYLLQWDVIRKAKHEGFVSYSLWGISPNEDQRHPLYGISLFKKGFPGEAKTYVGAWDFALSMKYHLVRAVEKYRKSRNGF
jgi:peptidoglycan pentaglycine glycine transferase (the first glycine)